MDYGKKKVFLQKSDAQIVEKKGDYKKVALGLKMKVMTMREIVVVIDI